MEEGKVFANNVVDGIVDEDVYGGEVGTPNA